MTTPALLFQGTVQVRRGNAADWTAANPTLAEAELGFELDTKKLKIGDGTTTWSALAYWGGGGGGVDGRGIASIAEDYQASTSGTVTPTGSWATSIPSVPKGEFLWTRVTVTLTDESTSTYYSVAYQGVDGSSGGGGGASFSAFYVVPHGFSGSVPAGYTQVTQDSTNTATVNLAAGYNIVAVATGGVGTVNLVKNAGPFTVDLADADGDLSSVIVNRN